MEELSLRKAHANDSEFVFAVKKAAFREYVEQVWGWDDNYQRELHNRRFAAQDIRIIQFRGIDVGFLATSSTPDTLKVNQIFILPEYQGKGIGSACMTRIIDAANLAQKSVTLQVLKVNTRGVAFYQRLGFTIVSENPTHFQMEKFMNFVEALSTDNLTAIRAAPKTDVHCHSFLSTRRENAERWLGHPLTKPSLKMDGLGGMMEYINAALAPHLEHHQGFEFIVGSAIRDAIQDGVVILEMSFDIRLLKFYPGGLTELRTSIEALVNRYREQIELRPELGFARECTADPKWMKLAHEAIELEFFQSIDLYSHQEACAPEAVQSLYAKARTGGMKLKAHVGEFRGAEEVRRTVEVLDLDEVQHGIGAAESIEVMSWLSENRIQLNVCPTSNVMLDGVSDLASHPIRTLFDNGVPVTINTDDLMIFGQSVSEEYRNLYQAGVFSAQELEDIRRASLVP